MAVAPRERPIRLVVRDDLRRNRLTIFFRLILAIPHFIWVTLWGIATFVVAIILWFAVLIQGRAPSGLHGFVSSYVRYSAHVGAYILLAANPYPGFLGRPGYAIDVEIDPPERQDRWTVLFRLLLALPALLLASTLGGGFSWGSSGRSVGSQSDEWYADFSGLSAAGVSAIAAVLVWFASLVRGRAPGGLRDLVSYAIGYAAQTGGYLLLLTDRYPSSDPALVDPLPVLPEHPVRIVVTDELGRARLTVAFRLLLAIPHLVWLVLWTVATFFAVIAAWFSALVTGRVPSALHRFLAAYVRYSTHVIAYIYVIGRLFPGFTGQAGSYGIDIETEPSNRQNRWKTLFRLFLAVPALFVDGALSGVLFVTGVFSWWCALVIGRVPEGLRNLGAACLRYSAQTSAYALLVTDRYPYASPVLEGRPEIEERPPPPPSSFPTPPAPPPWPPAPAPGDAS